MREHLLTGHTLSEPPLDFCAGQHRIKESLKDTMEIREKTTLTLFAAAAVAAFTAAIIGAFA
jgi:hypothetical protein